MKNPKVSNYRIEFELDEITIPGIKIEATVIPGEPAATDCPAVIREIENIRVYTTRYTPETALTRIGIPVIFPDSIVKKIAHELIPIIEAQIENLEKNWPNKI